MELTDAEKKSIRRKHNKRVHKFWNDFYEKDGVTERLKAWHKKPERPRKTETDRIIERYAI